VTQLLLDTVALLFAIREPDRLGAEADSAISDPTNELHVSAASAWEIATKTRIGKLRDGHLVVDDFEAHLRVLRGRPLSVTIAHALRAGSFPADHRDPFDRILAAQAMVEDLVVVTPDPAFAAFAVAVLW
jgi:PIN domain nuclease of toxin-antitoxin system